MNLKIGGSNVGKIMYNGQEFGGATKLEPGTILYVSKYNSTSFKDAHLLSTTKNWSNIDRIKITSFSNDINKPYKEFDISSDDFKNLDTEKKYKMTDTKTLTVSRSTVDGEYRLNVSGYWSNDNIAIRAI